MAIYCQAIPSAQSFAPGIIGYLDCQAQNIGVNGYAALAAPGSSAALLLTGMLTILIAVIGYRLMLGYSLDVREAVLTFAKIGLVLTLATSWPAYQALIYNVALRSPAELAAEVGGSAGLPGSTGGLVARLDGVDRAMQWLAIAGVGSYPAEAGGALDANSVAPQPTPGFNDFALGYARIGFLVSTIAAFGIVRLLAGVLLAIGPLFAAFLLFDGTRPLFEGWLRGLIGATLAAFASTIVLSVELAFLEPWLAQLLARRSAQLDILGAPAELLATMAIFGVSLAAVMFVTLRVASGLRISRWQQAIAAHRLGASSSHTVVSTAGANFHAESSRETRSRASVIADSVAHSERRISRSMSIGRESVLGSSGSSSRQGRYGGQVDRSTSNGRIVSPARSMRRSSRRSSAGAARRDRTR